MGKEERNKKEKKGKCMVCGAPSDESICETCKAKIRGEALEKKLQDEKKGKTDTGRK